MVSSAAAEEVKQEEEEKKAPEEQKTAYQLAMEKSEATLKRLENYQQNSQSNALQKKMRALSASSDKVREGVEKCEEIHERIQDKMANKMEEAKEVN